MPCGKSKSFMPNFCQEHSEYYKSKSNEEIIGELSQSFRDCLCITPEKKIGASMDKRSWASFTNLFNELMNRGYHYEEVARAIKATQDAKGILDDIFAEIGHNPKWRRFEKLVSAIHKIQSDDTNVTYDDKIIGKRTGRERQIDISIKFNHLYYSYLLIIECKDYKSPVPITAVEAFRTKLEDVGADKGVMVSSSGFQQGAVETAKAYGIELFTLTEEKSDWTRRLREFKIALPFPYDISFDHPSIPKDERDLEQKPIGFAEILFYKSPSKPPRSLLDILKDLCLWALDTSLRLPSKLNVRFRQPFLMKIPSREQYVPVYGLKVVMIQYQYRESKNIDIPPTILNYKYEDIAKGKTHEIPVGMVKKDKG